MRRSLALLVLLITACLTVPAGAWAGFGLSKANVQFLEEDGSAATLAGAHPFAMKTTFKLNSAVSGGKETPEGALKDLEVELPLGFAGIPAATPRCAGSQFITLDESFLPQPIPECPNDSAVGYAEVLAAFHPVPVAATGEEGSAVIYNLVPAPGTVAKFGFVFLKVPVTIELRLSEKAPYRVIATMRNAPQPLLVYGAAVTIWGTPAAAAHDPYRGRCFGGVEADGTLVSQGNCPVEEGTPQTALLTLPRACQGPLGSLFRADSWTAPGVDAEMESSEKPSFGDCPGLGFAPAWSVSPSTRSADSPAGFDVGVEFGESDGVADPAKRANSDLRRIVAKLPEGVTLNPSAADGLAACTTAQYEAEKLESLPGENCPEASNIGTVTATSPLIEESLQGEIFTAEPNDNPFGSFLAIYLVLRNQNLGVIVKQAGEVRADPATGQLTAIFDEAPQLPIERIETHFREGPRAPLVSPGQCGSYVAEALQTSWSGKQVTTTAEFKIDSGCLPGQGTLAPGFQAGTTANAAGSYAPFMLHLTRRDGEADLTHLSVAMPQGLTGKLAGIGRCPDSAIAGIGAKSGRAELASPTCPASSRIGKVVAGAGVGPALTYVTGTAYLAGPYLGAPFSVLVITPAVAGPFDLGNVVVREPLRIDPFTAQVSVDGSAAPLPRILKGIPLRLRDLQIDVDRPGFTLNPSSCEPKQIAATAAGAGPSLSSTGETSADLTVRYQAAGCSALGFKPKLKLSLKGSTKHAGHPALKAVVTYPKQGAYANIARAQVNLPHSEFIDQANLNKTCTRPVLVAGNCPSTSIYGKAKAWTPLLEKPLEGPVYLVGGFGYKLPALVAELNGQIRVLLAGKVDSGPNKGIRNTFEAVPDAPVEKFVIELKGGPKYSLLENSENLCAKPQRAIARFTAQNGRVDLAKPLIANQCRKAKGGKKAHSKKGSSGKHGKSGRRGGK
jgi:hypothetical protein